MIGHINNIYQKIAFTILLLLITSAVFSQIQSEAVRLSGVIIDADNRQAVPYVSVQVSGTQYGTAADNNGYFSLFLNPGDTLQFSSIGYKKADFIMPYQVATKSYSLVQLLVKESVLLDEVVIFPWPSLKSFEQAFLDTQPKRNMNTLVKEVQRDLEKLSDESTESAYYYDQMRYQKLYELHGEVPPNNFLNPIRWSNFIRDTGKNKKDDE